MNKYQVEIPVNDNSIQTTRSLDRQHPNNVNLLKDYPEQKYKELLEEVKIRFDTNPKYYQKEDYKKLIELLQLKGQGEGGLFPDDLKTINGESIVGDGDIKTPDCELSVDYAFQLEGKYIFTEGDYDNTTETITPLHAEYNEQTETITIL